MREVLNMIQELGDLHTVRTTTLEVGYHALGPAHGPVVLLLHGYPYDVRSYREVAPRLAGQGFRTIVPYLRGHGPTRFLRKDAARSGQQAALGTDVVELLDALHIEQAVLAGYDWGGRAACVASAVWPERVTGLVTVNGYLIQNIATADRPLNAGIEAGLWYFFYFLTERGRAGLSEQRRDIAEVIWRRNSPSRPFDAALLDSMAPSFDNPDYVDLVIHSYRHRLGHADGAAEYAQVERLLAASPAIRVPTITLDGTADGNFPATDGSADAARFTGPRRHRQVSGAGHHLPYEAPDAFAAAVSEVATLRRAP
jgi:pimeloyl-ACP methyl ester carboxylesterase